MAQKRDHGKFDQEVVPLRGRYAGKTIKVSKYQKIRLLKMNKVVLPGSIKANKLENKTEKEADSRKDK